MIDSVYADFSIFLSNEWENVYQQTDKVKAVFLSYKSCDIVSMCLIARHNHVFYHSLFMPDIEYEDSGLKETGLVSFDFCQQYSQEEQKKIAEKELKKFNFQQKQIPADVLMKSHNEQVRANKYLLYFDDNFYRFYFFNKNKIEKMLNYLALIEKKQCELDCTNNERMLRLRFDRLEVSRDTFNLMKGYPDTDFYYSMNCAFHSYYTEGFLELAKEMYDHIRNNIQDIIEHEKSASTLLKTVIFCEPFSLAVNGIEILPTGMLALYNKRNKFIAYYPDNNEYVKICCCINLLRAKIILNSGNNIYLLEVVKYLRYLEAVIPFHKETEEINTQILDCLKNYVTQVHQHEPYLLESKELLLDIYDSFLSLPRLRKNLGV